MDYNILTSEQCDKLWNELDKEMLAKSRAELTPLQVRKLFLDPSLDNSVIWPYRYLDEAGIEEFAVTENDWRFVCLMYKMSPLFMTKHKSSLQLTYIQYEQYTADELMRTDGILFPLHLLKNRKPADLIKLVSAGKLTNNRSGGIATQQANAWGYQYYGYGRYAINDPIECATYCKSWSELKPFFKASRNVAHYHGKMKLTYDNLVEVLTENPRSISSWDLNMLLQRGKLSITNEEWDGLMALLVLGR